MNQQENHLDNLYDTHLNNLRLLQSQKAGFDYLNVPVHIINQTNNEVSELLRLCELLNKEIPDEVKIVIVDRDRKAQEAVQIIEQQK
ncbi:MAG: hypothetical protein ABIF11_11110 [Nitrospirota bacterium]